MVVFFGLRGAHHGECRPSINNDLSTNKPCQALQSCVDLAMEVFLGGLGPHQGECRPSVNNDLTTKKHAKHRKHLWRKGGRAEVGEPGAP